MTTSDNEWQRVTKSDKERQRVEQRVTTNVNEWPFQLIFFFLFKSKRSLPLSTLKENFLNFEEDLWRRPIELRAETSTQKEILPVRSRNCRSSCSQIFIKLVFLKVLQYSPFYRFAGFKTCNFLKKGLQHKYFPVLESPFKKVAGLEAHKSIKRRLRQRFLWILQNS